MKQPLIILITCIFSLTCSGQSVFDYINTANEKANNGDCKGAIQDYDKALEQKPDFTMVMNMKALCLIELNETDQACDLFRKAKEMGSGKSSEYIDKYCANRKTKIEKKNVNCKMAHNGKFKYGSNQSDTTAYIERKGNKQTEYYENNKYQTEFNIKWISDCEYELTFINTNDPALNFLTKGDKLTIIISNVNDKQYEYQSNLNGMISTGTHIKIE
ncbi:MAG: tetratricopeptide repeat protein [Bacteroidia bacterium]